MKCVVCGKNSERSLCVDCYLKKNRIVEIEDVEVTVCPRCGMFRISGKWKAVDLLEAVSSEVEKKLRVHPDFKVERVELKVGERGELLLGGSFWNKDVEEFLEFEIKLKKVLCEKCSREAGGYYECIVQLRADRELEESEIDEVNRIVLETIEKAKEDTKAFISKVVERREGVDYYIGGRNIGRKISKSIVEKFGGKITESKKIAGRKDGRDIYRFTYSVRLPAYRKGDIVSSENKIVVVTNPKLKKGLTLPELKNVNLKDARVVVRREDIEEGIVVSCDKYGMEVMKLSTGEVVTVERIKELKVGDKVKIFEVEKKHYAFPEKL